MALLSPLVRRSLWIIILIPIINGAICGSIYVYYNFSNYAEQLRDYDHELAQDEWTETFKAPGQPLVETSDNGPPYYLTRLRSHDWLPKLNLIRPPMPPGMHVSMDMAGSLDDLYVTKAHLKHHWIFLTYVSCPDCDVWDKSFGALLQHHNEVPPANNASFTYVRCFDSPFLCKMWGSDGPAMIHLSADLEQCVPNPVPDIFQRVAEDGSDTICPVTARLIELPLKEFPGTDVFTGPLQQLRALTDEPLAYTMIPYYDSDKMQNNKWSNYLDNLAENYVWFAPVMKSSDLLTGLDSPVGPIIDFIETVGFFTATAVCGLTANAGLWTFTKIKTILGFPEPPPRTVRVSPGSTYNLMKDMVDGFVAELKKNMTEEEHSNFVGMLKEFAANQTSFVR